MPTPTEASPAKRSFFSGLFRRKEKAPPTPEQIAKRKAEGLQGSFFTEIMGVLNHLGMGKQRFLIIQNLSMMLEAGLPLVDSLKTLEKEAQGKAAKKLIQRMRENVENGTPLWRAMLLERFFPPDALALVRIGEEAGNLAKNMQYLSTQQEKDQALKSKVKMAMIYPSIVMVLMFIVVMGLGMFVLPNLVQVLYSLNVPLPLVTRIVIAFTQFMSTYGMEVVPASLVAMVVLAALVQFTSLRRPFQWLSFQIPGIGTLLREATIARFGVLIGGLLQAGVPLTDAMRSLAEVTTLVSYKNFYQAIYDHITLGDSFAKSFAAIAGCDKLLPPSVQQLVMTGEQTGSLMKIMLKVADIYEKKANDTAQRLPVILEPMLLIIIASLVGTIAFAIIVPIYSIVGNIGH